MNITLREKNFEIFVNLCTKGEKVSNLTYLGQLASFLISFQAKDKVLKFLDTSRNIRVNPGFLNISKL